LISSGQLIVISTRSTFAWLYILSELLFTQSLIRLRLPHDSSFWRPNPVGQWACFLDCSWRKGGGQFSRAYHQFEMVAV
jgi:hypothetical protein